MFDCKTFKTFAWHLIVKHLNNFLCEVFSIKMNDLLDASVGGAVDPGPGLPIAKIKYF
jgi:hypothetical protein